jgi:hypothetical protein
MKMRLSTPYGAGRSLTFLCCLNSFRKMWWLSDRRESTSPTRLRH